MVKSVNHGEPTGPPEAMAPKSLAAATGEVGCGRARRFGEAAVKSHRLDYATQEKSGTAGGEVAVRRGPPGILPQSPPLEVRAPVGGHAAPRNTVPVPLPRHSAEVAKSVET